MIEKYIIGKEDLPKLIRGEELPLSQGSKARAFKIEITGNLTNGDMVKAMFPNLKIGVFRNEVDVEGLDTYSVFTRNWWNAPYEGGKKE